MSFAVLGGAISSLDHPRVHRCDALGWLFAEENEIVGRLLVSIDGFPLAWQTEWGGLAGKELLPRASVLVDRRGMPDYSQSWLIRDGRQEAVLAECGLSAGERVLPHRSVLENGRVLLNR